MLAGCGGSGGDSLMPTPPTPAGGASFSGTVEGGQNPVAGAAVSFYAAGDGYGAGARLLGSATSGRSGGFTMHYDCPSGAAEAETYITATGGNAGNGRNSAIGLLAALGPCNALTSSTIVVVNELTTVAAEWALVQFSDTTGANIGAPATNPAGLQNSYAVFANLADVNSSGYSVSGNASSLLPTAADCSSSSAPVNCGALEKLDTVANVIAACVSSAGASSGACETLFSNTGTPSTGTTLAAAHTIAANPATNVSAIFGLQGTASSAPFQPALTSAPNDWTLALNYTGGGLSGPAAIAIDAVGDAWIANDGGVVVKFAPNGGILSGPSGFTGGGFDHCFGIAIDSAGNAWITNKYTATTNGTVTELASNGGVLSGASGYTAGGIDYPLALAIDPSGNVSVANYANASVTKNPQSSSAANFTGGGLSFPVSIAIDGSGDVWTANFGNDSVTELGPDGSPLSGSGGYTAGGLDGPASIALDASGRAWVANYYGDSVSELDSTGGAAAGSPFSGGGLSGPAAIALDGAGNVWVANYTGDSVTELEGASGAAPGAPLSGGSGYTGGLATPNGLAIDESGNLWAANFSADSVTEFVGVAMPVKTPVFGPPTKP